MKILLVKEHEKAKNIVADATVEAEYGSHVVKGTKVTMAHHVEEYKHMRAPSMQEVPVLEENSTILISHVDLDTLVGIMRLMGRPAIEEKANKGFFEAIEYIDLNGPHNLNNVKEYANMFNAYWAWSEENYKWLWAEEESEGVLDVSIDVLIRINVLERIIAGERELIEKGTLWAIENEKNIESSLLEETEKLRVFVGPYFTAASYYSPKLESISEATVSFTTTNKSLTVAVSNKAFNCSEVMQKLFGPEAGGHFSIAGSPRGKEMTLKDLYYLVEEVKFILNK